MTACAVLLSVFSTLRMIDPNFFGDMDIHLSREFLIAVCWFAPFSPIALWTACGIRHVGSRIAAFGTLAVLGWTGFTDGDPLFLLFCLWVLVILALIRLSGYRFLCVANRGQPKTSFVASRETNQHTS